VTIDIRVFFQTDPNRPKPIQTEIQEANAGGLFDSRFHLVESIQVWTQGFLYDDQKIFLLVSWSRPRSELVTIRTIMFRHSIASSCGVGSKIFSTHTHEEGRFDERLRKQFPMFVGCLGKSVFLFVLCCLEFALISLRLSERFFFSSVRSMRLAATYLCTVLYDASGGLSDA